MQILTPISPNLEALRALNNAHAQELSFADIPHFTHLVTHATFSRHIGDEAFLLAFGQDANYTGENFLWFRARFPRFLYIDRVVTAPAARGKGHAATLYAALFHHAAATGHTLITCEINEDPPNPASDAFHTKQGFTPIGRATLPNGKQVRYFSRILAA